MPTRWVIPNNVSANVAPIHFHFPKPIEGYSGKVTSMRGRIQFVKDCMLSGAHGWFEVDVKNVTLGEDALDDSVRNSVEFLYSPEFPTSRFEFQSIDSSSSHLTTVDTIRGFLVGNFTLKGVSIPLRARATLRPHRHVDGQWHLDLTAEFTLEQLREVFHIAGPGGESEPAGNRMFFEVKTTLVPENGLSLCEFR